MDDLTRSVLNRGSINQQILTVSDGVLKGYEVKRMAAEFRAQESIGAMTERILRENGCRVI